MKIPLPPSVFVTGKCLCGWIASARSTEMLRDHLKAHCLYQEDAHNSVHLYVKNADVSA